MKTLKLFDAFIATKTTSKKTRNCKRSIDTYSKSK